MCNTSSFYHCNSAKIVAFVIQLHVERFLPDDVLSKWAVFIPIIDFLFLSTAHDLMNSTISGREVSATRHPL